MLILCSECIRALEASTSSSALACRVPTTQYVAKLYSAAENAVAVNYDCQANIDGHCQAYLLAVRLADIKINDQLWRTKVQMRLQTLLWQLHSRFEKSGQWEKMLVRTLRSEATAETLVKLLSKVTDAQPSSEIQKVLAAGLNRLLRQGHSYAISGLLPAIEAAAKASSFCKLHEDLQVAITAWLVRYTADEQLPEPVGRLRDALTNNDIMADGDARETFRELSASCAVHGSRPRPRKRRRMSPEVKAAPSINAAAQIQQIIPGTSEDLTNLASRSAAAYPDLSEEQQCEVWQLLGQLVATNCAAAVQAMTEIVSLPQFRMRHRPRVWAIPTIQEGISKTTGASALSLKQSVLGKCLLSSLHSSQRELRIAAGQCLPCFLRDDLPDGLTQANRHDALEYLRHLSDRDVSSEHETLIGAWSQVAQACGDRELHLVLLRLTEYLGHPNSLVSAVAHDELGRLATARGQTAKEMLSPFWSSVAVSVAQDLQTRPQKADLMCDLLEVDLDGFLAETQSYTVPTLVLTKKKDILQRVANARRAGSPIYDLIMASKTTMAATAALLLLQPVNDPEEAGNECLSAASSTFRGEDMALIVKTDAPRIACELLKLTAEAADGRKTRHYRSFQIFAAIAVGRSRGSAKGNKVLYDFFSTHSLGVMFHFSEALDGVTTHTGPLEKLRNVQALKEMVHLSKSHASIALPQIRAFLQSAMSRPELCEAAFLVLLELLAVLESNFVAQMLGQTFALLIEHWNSLTQETQYLAHVRIDELTDSHQAVFLDNVMYLPALGGIPALSKVAGTIADHQSNRSIPIRCQAYEKRMRDESHVVVRQALRELVPFLTRQQDFIHTAATSEQPVPVLAQLVRAIFDVMATHGSQDDEVAELCSRALGIIGCLDPNRVEAPRTKRQVLVLTNFLKASEATEWVVALLEEVLIKAFRAGTNPRAQGFMAYVIQELLRFTGINPETLSKTRSSVLTEADQKWLAFPEHVRITLTPFVTSKYHIFNPAEKPPDRKYPGFTSDVDYVSWIRSLVYDLMFKAKGDNPKMIFPLIARLVRTNDTAIANYLLPYVALNVVLDGTVKETEGITQEFLAVLQCQTSSNAQLETAKQCGETVFSVLDYMSSLLQEKRKVLAQTRADAYRTGQTPPDFDEVTQIGQIETIESFMASMPADALASRAVDCGSYARALFNWEQHIRHHRELTIPTQMSQDEQTMYDRLHEIYANIDEPDGLEGLGACMSFLTEEQQAMQHAKAGRWTAASAWYETQLADTPDDARAQVDLLTCLRETGQYAALLRYAQSFLQHGSKELKIEIQRLAMEAQWMSGEIDGSAKLVSKDNDLISDDISYRIGRMLAASASGDVQMLADQLSVARVNIAQSVSEATTSSIQASHATLKKLHALYELEALCSRDDATIAGFRSRADKRLAVLGSYNDDKQYMLSLRAAAMATQAERFRDDDGGLLLATAKLARKAGNMHRAYQSVAQAYLCRAPAAKLEEAKLFWHDGHQRQAIQALQSAIAIGVLGTPDGTMINTESSTQTSAQHVLRAKAQLLLAKWLDATGQSQTKDMTSRYQAAAREHQRWEKGHYYLGKHYNKLLEAEKQLPKNKHSSGYLSGEMTRSVIENLMRSIPFGNKYWHETIPKVLTLWLDLGADTVNKAPREDPAIFAQRQKALQSVNKQFQKYYERIPPYVFYGALPQLLSRISHPHPDVWNQLALCLIRIISTHPSQAMWYLLPVLKATERTRSDRGMEILHKLKNDSKLRSKAEGVDLPKLIAHSQKLSDALLQACERQVEPRRTHISLRRDLEFAADRLAPVQLVVPVESTLQVNVPSGATTHIIRKHKAFEHQKITIQAFMDDVLVLSSLQRPRRITIRGSDGKLYPILCKPKDDLRKDQRLMDFNGIINRALKRDAESSKRRLYIKTYAVTPLSEESGTLEWVEGIKPLRDILLAIYNRRGTHIQYNRIKDVLDAAKSPSQIAAAFEEEVLPIFPPALHEWFTETYSNPEAWFAARLRYARTAAVMSIVGHVLGLGDRHGENILLQESTGGVFHVDFNCLFDKGRTFEKPELVPFRLTHNMVDAMGAYGYEGPFRKSSELTFAQLKQNRDTLMTVLETFLYDPTTDFVGKKKRNISGVPETPQEILDSVDGKLKGLLRGEHVPLGVEGYCEALIQEATSSANLGRKFFYLGPHVRPADNNSRNVYWVGCTGLYPNTPTVC